MGFPICTIGEQLILRRWACSPQCATGYTCSLIASEAFAAGMPSSDYNAQAPMQYGARGMAPCQTGNPRADGRRAFGGARNVQQRERIVRIGQKPVVFQVARRQSDEA